ncbi:MAG: molybdopterin cofactor-binding domain-containing protein [Planctomycetaceae bacterium]
MADTDSVGYTRRHGGSRVTHTTGMAAHKAAMIIRDKLCDRAAAIWNVPRDTVSYEDGCVVAKSGQKFTFAEIAAKVPHTGEAITVSADVNATSCSGAPAHLVDVAVDRDRQDRHPPLHRRRTWARRFIPVTSRGRRSRGRPQGIGWALERGILLRRQRPDAELDLPRLSDANDARRADDRLFAG